MIEELVALLLAPLLLAQGRRARSAALVLPEADGPRSGRHGAFTRVLRVLIVGDSAAAGVGVATQDEALAGQLVRALAAALPRTAIEWRLIARTGVTTREALAMLRGEDSQVFDVVVVALGVNDVTSGARVAHWLAAMAELLAELRERWGAPTVLVSGLPPMHRFPLLPQPLRWYLGRRARRLDVALATWARAQQAVRHVALPDADPSLIAADGFHPGAGACAIWGERLAAEIVGRRAAEKRTAP